MGINARLLDVITENEATIYYIVNASTKTAKYADLTNVGTLESFRDEVNAGTFNYDEAKLIEDIKLNVGKYTISNGEITFANDAIQWIPIGTSSKSFKKIFDGQNHTISGIYINNEDLNYASLFGYLEGTIKNVGIINGKIIGKQHCGGIVGWAASGNILNCFNENSIEGKSYYTGGIIGSSRYNIKIEKCYNKGNIQSTTGICGGISGIAQTGTTIKECYNIGDVTGSANVGGICGDTRGIIEKCYNIGKVESAGDYVGGIAGSGRENIRKCYNIGEIEGARYVGGITGSCDSNKEIFNCYNIGKIEGTSRTGGIVGLNNGKIINCYTITGTLQGTKENSYYLTETTTSDTAAKTENYMKSQAFVTLLNTLTTTTTDEETEEEVTTTATQDVWKMDTNNINDGYPILKWQE